MTDPGPCTLIYAIYRPKQRTVRVRCGSLTQAWAKQKELQAIFDQQQARVVWRIEGADGTNLPTEPEDSQS